MNLKKTDSRFEMEAVVFLVHPTSDLLTKIFFYSRSSNAYRRFPLPFNLLELYSFAIRFLSSLFYDFLFLKLHSFYEKLQSQYFVIRLNSDLKYYSLTCLSSVVI